MSQGRLTMMKKFRISPDEVVVLADKDQLVAYMRKLNVEVNKVYETINEGKFDN